MKVLEFPSKGDYPDYFDRYLSLLSGKVYEEHILLQIEELKLLFKSKVEEWANTPYEKGKWSPKEVLGHITDTERIFSFRALSCARGEKSALPGFDHDSYVQNSELSDISSNELIKDFEIQRLATLSLLSTLPDKSLDILGNANGGPITARAVFWVIPGHFKHHLKILKERY